MRLADEKSSTWAFNPDSDPSTLRTEHGRFPRSSSPFIKEQNYERQTFECFTVGVVYDRPYFLDSRKIGALTERPYSCVPSIYSQLL